MRKILIALLGVLLVAALAGAGTFAYFSDTETSTGNTFTAGTLDLTLGESEGAPVNLTNMKPGDTAEGTITVKNVGSLAGSLYATANYVEKDGTQPVEFPTNVSADEFAKMLLITKFTADGVSVPNPDVDGDGRTTLYDMVNNTSGVTLSGYPSPGKLETWYSYDTDMISQESHAYHLAVQFDPNAGNDYQGDGITLTFYFLLKQQ
jgi:predicted ribosomally synthesized peptide with SipW-like signal peptide